MKLGKDENNNNIIDFLKWLIRIFNIRLTIGFIIFSVGMFSFFSLVVPSIKIMFSLVPLVNIEDYFSILLEGCFLGFLFGFVYCLKSFEIKKRIDLTIILFFCCLIGIFVSFFNGVSGLNSILDIIRNENYYIYENTPIGQLFDYWGIYNNPEGIDIFPWIAFIIFTILIIIMDIIIGFFLCIIIGLPFSITKYIQKTYISKTIMFFQLVFYTKKYVFLSGLIGLLYGIEGSIIMYIMAN
jgi:hypothetical protein